MKMFACLLELFQFYKVHMKSHDTIRYDTIRQKSLTWTRKLSIQLNLAHVARNYKTNKQCPFNSVHVKIREVSPEGIRVTMEERICERDEF